MLTDWLSQQGVGNMQIRWDCALTQLNSWERLWDLSKASQQVRGSATITLERLLLDGNLKTSLAFILAFT